MPDVSPFRGVRYDVARVGTLSDVVAPPYDVIDPALQDRLYAASPYNVIRLELNRDEPGDSADRRSLRAGGPVPEGLAATGNSSRGRSPRLLRLPPDLRGRGENAHAQGVPGAGAARADRPGQDLSPRADPGRAQGRPAGPVPRDRIQPQPDLWTLSRLATARCSARSKSACATARRWSRPTTWVSKTGSGSSPTRRRTRPSAA